MGNRQVPPLNILVPATVTVMTERQLDCPNTIRAFTTHDNCIIFQLRGTSSLASIRITTMRARQLATALESLAEGLDP
jgi:hypothetical protein